MYIPEFVCGITVTLAVEGFALIAVGVKMALKEKKEDKGSAEEKPMPTGTYTDGGKWYDGTS